MNEPTPLALTDSTIQDLGNLLRDSLQNIVEGATQDLDMYSQGIAQDLAEAITLPESEKRDALIKELKGQAVGILEINRLRVSDEGRKAVQSIIEAIATTGALIIRKALISI